MGHYAKIDSNNIVTQVIVADASYINSLSDSSSYIKTSYNTNMGKHYQPDSTGNTSLQTESSDQSKSLRFRFAGVGMYYDSTNDVFYEQKPPDKDGDTCNSWTLNTSTWTLEAPITMPTLTDSQFANQKIWVWDESVYQADNTQGWVLVDGQQ